MSDHPYDDEPTAAPSKSQLKREMHALQALGQELTALSAREIEDLVTEPTLLTALLEYQRIKSNEARRRQLQFIGKLMRKIDVGEIEAALEQRRFARQRANDAFHALERSRDQLIEGQIEVHELAAEFPGADAQRIRQWVLQARREKNAGKPPAASRKLLRYLRELQTQA